MMLLIGASLSTLVTTSLPAEESLDSTQNLALRDAALIPAPSITTVSATSFQAREATLLYPQQYHNSSQVEEELQNLNETFPQLVDLKIIGKSWQNKSIWAMIVTNEAIPDDQKAHVLFVAEHHAREIITTEVSLRFMMNLLNNFANHEEVQFLLNHVVIHYIPVLNPDGFDDVVTNGHFWQRKNGHPMDEDGDGLVDEDPLDNPSFCGFDACSGQDNDGDGRTDEDPLGGVDLNRNYDFHWGDCPSIGFCNGDADEPITSETYPGDSPFSEPETRAFRDYVANLTVSAALSYHSGTNATLFPWGYPGLPPPPDKATFDTIKDQLKQFLPASYWTNSVGYGVAGEWGDWYYEEHGTITSTIEVYGNNNANDIYHYFNPDPANIEFLHEELLDFEYYWVSLAPIINVSTEINQNNVLRVTMRNLSPALTTFEPINTQIQLTGGPGIEQATLSIVKSRSSELLNASQSIEYFVTINNAAATGNYTITITTGNDWTGKNTYLVQLRIESGSESSNTSKQGTAQATPGFSQYLAVLGLGSLFLLTRRKKRIERS